MVFHHLPCNSYQFLLVKYMSFRYQNEKSFQITRNLGVGWSKLRRSLRLLRREKTIERDKKIRMSSVIHNSTSNPWHNFFKNCTGNYIFTSMKDSTKVIKVNLLTYSRETETLSMKSNNSVLTYFSKVFSLINKSQQRNRMYLYRSGSLRFDFLQDGMGYPEPVQER